MLKRYHVGYNATKANDTTSVFGWYDKLEWVTIRFVKKVRDAWLIATRATRNPLCFLFDSDFPLSEADHA